MVPNYRTGARVFLPNLAVFFGILNEVLGSAYRQDELSGLTHPVLERPFFTARISSLYWNLPARLTLRINRRRAKEDDA